MKAQGHLRIEEAKLLPGLEWVNNDAAYRFVRVSSGSAYWLDPVKPRAFAEGELVVLAPSARAVIRASQLNDVTLHWFQFAPDLLCGFFTLAERHFFQNRAAPANGVQFLPSTHPVSQRFRLVVAQRTPNRELAERAELLGIVAAFFDEGITDDPVQVVPATTARDRFQQIISQMPELELIHHTPEQLAHFCGCSTRHFNRLFRHHFGHSPRARQTELRLLKA